MRLSGWLAVAARVWALAGGALLLVIVAATVANVGAFMIGIAALSGYEDFVRLAVGSALLMLLPYCQLAGGHVTADVFTARLPGGLRGGLDRIWRWLTALATLMLGISLALGMLETRADNVLSPILGWREWPFYLPAIASLLLWSAVAAAGREADGG